MSMSREEAESIVQKILLGNKDAVPAAQAAAVTGIGNTTKIAVGVAMLAAVVGGGYWWYTSKAAAKGDYSLDASKK